MSEHKIDTVVEGTLTSLLVRLEGKKLGLSRDGETFTSSKVLDIDGPLNLVFHARGIAFSAWKITITLDDGEEPVFKKSGHLTIDNESILKEAIILPGVDAAAAALRLKSKRRAPRKPINRDRDSI
jgi:hypothetical protein